jgi:predicted RNase H-like nuclease (RuvC/YqgF family)
MFEKQMNPQYEAYERLCKSIGDMFKENETLKERIKRLEEMYEGEIGENEQFLGSNLQGLLTRELNWSKQRIKQLESWIDSLEVLEQHSGIPPEREWFGSEIGYLRKGEAVYKGEAKP